jgi:hypothetical protein
LVREGRGHRITGPITPSGEGRERHWVAAALVVAAVASAYTAYASSEASAASMEYQSKVSERQAEAARRSAAIAAENQREEDQRILAAQRARLGGAGVIADAGSPLLAQMEDAETAALNEARIRWSGETQATGFEAEAIGQRFAARQTRRLGYLQAGSSLIAGLSKAYGAYRDQRPTPESEPRPLPSSRAPSYYTR